MKVEKYWENTPSGPAQLKARAIFSELEARFLPVDDRAVLSEFFLSYLPVFLVSETEVELVEMRHGQASMTAAGITYVACGLGYLLDHIGNHLIRRQDGDIAALFLGIKGAEIAHKVSRYLARYSGL